MTPLADFAGAMFERAQLADSLQRMNARKILIIKPSALGDVVHSLPFLHAVRERFPDAEIHWVIAKAFEDFLRGHPMISRLWVIDKDRWKRLGNVRETFRALRDLMGRLKAERYDLVVDLQGLFRSGLLCGGTQSPVRVGFREGREGSPFFYTHRVRGGVDLHAIDRYMKIAAFLGASTEPLVYPFSETCPDSPIVKSLPVEYVVMAPSAGGEAKKWPAERFGQLATKLPWPTLVISGKGDAAQVEQVVAASGGKAISLAGRTTLCEATEVIRRARALVSNDTGPMHIAAALGVPVFAVFGPTNPLRTGPYGALRTTITADLACSPCYRRKPCARWICMESISVDRVLRTMQVCLGF
jgi:heptosyltransferase I